MDDLLTAVKTTRIQDVNSEHHAPKPQRLAAVSAATSTPDQALKVLREQPDPQSLHDVLGFLQKSTRNSADFNVRVPEPLSAQVIGTLVNSTIPDYWETWNQSDHSDRSLVLQSLKSVGGLGALVARMKSLCVEEQAQSQQQIKKSRSTRSQIRIILDVLSRLITGSDFASAICTDVNKFVSASNQRQILWREFVSLTASGRIVSVSAQAEDLLKETSEQVESSWLSSGPRFATWIGCNVVTLLGSGQGDVGPAAALLLGKSLTLGYNEHIVGEIISDLVADPSSKSTQLQRLLQKTRAHEQRQFLFSTIDWISKKHLGAQRVSKMETEKEQRALSGASALIAVLISSSNSMKDALVNWLSSENCVGSFLVRRAAIAALQTDEDRMTKVMERTMEQFGDELFIKHTPIVHQEALAQVLLISSGYVHRSDPMFLFTVARSSVHMSGTSNRLSASSLRARFLGMVTAMAISELIDKPDKRLKFDIPQTESAEAQWYLQLVRINDSIGNLDDVSAERKTDDKSSSMSKKAPKFEHQCGPLKEKEAVTTATGPRIVEILDSDQDDDLIPYAKPDSDPEDDHEDPTLVTRNKPTAPVYIRDLLAGLREAEDYDKHHLALSTAASLIRRKTNFGKEVKDSLDELAFVLTNLKDQFNMDEFEEMRQQGLIAVLLAEPEEMGPLFVHSFYTGDFSISQRAAILTALGLGARELADFGDDDENNSKDKASSSFPTKTLPPALHKIYSADDSKTPIDAMSNQLKQRLISPLALDAADKLTGPSALKVRTFSSRMDVAKRRRVINNALAKVVAHGIFFPLTGGWWAYARASGMNRGGGGAGNGILHSPHVLPLLLKTLAIVLHAAGPATLSLPQMTAELLDLLLSLRAVAVADAAVLEAVLFALLAAMEVNEDGEQLVRDQARELLETQEWVRTVFENTAGGSEEEERVRSLAAAVLVRIGDVVERWQRLMMGDLVDF
ncbi:telomere length regulation protein-domain-containing protein [Phyllosticta citribraziliensis]|uniref:Telomere length regulation protein-domain-containing protein n=1 Tax=Phyllosticta citribraziliensis TaxID=989973 RepID=A0ABR1LZY1_9PEZI